ncbi:hypothetical protein GALLN_00578 [Gallionellaceae bacterium]|nr:hypothetical protein GALLN_00578 [Gallionellaceae bacterium]
MQFRFFGKKFLLVAMLSIGSAVSTLGATAANSATQAKPAAFDFTVVSASKDATRPRSSEGSDTVFLVNGVEGRTLILVRGKTYTFNIDTGVRHDFYITNDPAGGGTGALTEGVTGNFTHMGVVTFKPTATTPDVLYYQCRNHKYAGGQINIVNPGKEDKIMIAKPVAAPTAKVTKTIDKVDLKQKLDFANMTINKSDAATRIAASTNAEAKAKLKDAQAMLAAGQSAFNAGNLALAEIKIDEATKLMGEAARLVPSEFVLGKAKARYEELLQGIKRLETAFAQNYETISKEPGAKNLQPLDDPKIRKSKDAAKALFTEGKYDKANEILNSLQDEVIIALNKLLANRTISYEMKFETVEQEYQYELARYIHFEELIPLAIEQKQPTRNLLSLMESHVNKGKEKRDQAAADAKQKNFAAALEKIKAASDDIESGLQVIGVRY